MTSTIKLSPSNALSVAVLIDGGFFIKRYNSCFGKNHSAKQIVDKMYEIADKHSEGKYFYRLFYYDCKPFTKRIQNPIAQKLVNFAQTDVAVQRQEIFDELKKRRKAALRLGELKERKRWSFHHRVVKELINGTKNVSSCTEHDIYYDLIQKGVDIKIGVDIASLSLQKLVHQIVLISGDSDFVPAAKLARVAGVDFILNPMNNRIDQNLLEHIDGLESVI